MSPLAKPKPDAPGYVERFEGFAAGMEIANSYTELNDPELQRERFMAQEELRLLYKDEEVERLDEDFLLALEYGDATHRRPGRGHRPACDVAHRPANDKRRCALPPDEVDQIVFKGMPFATESTADIESGSVS